MTKISSADGEAQVKKLGYNRVVTFTDEKNAYYEPHKHDGESTHLVLEGEMIVKFPEDENPQKRSYGPGERIDFKAWQMHEIWIGDEGCVSVIGEMKADTTMNPIKD